MTNDSGYCVWWIQRALKCMGPDVLSPSHPSPTRPLILRLRDRTWYRAFELTSFALYRDSVLRLLAMTMPNGRRKRMPYFPFIFGVPATGTRFKRRMFSTIRCALVYKSHLLG